MSWIPGWQTAADADWWSSVWFWVSIASLMLLGVSEVISHRYSERKDELSTKQQEVAERQHNDTIAALQLQTAQAIARAAEANSALDKYKAPRALTEEQMASFIDVMKSASGQEYILSVASGNEPANLVCLLDSLLKRAKWKRLEQQNMGISVNTQCGRIALNAISEVQIRVSTKASETTNANADKLIAALNNHRITVQGTKDPLNVPADKVIVIMVGTKQ